MAGGLFATVAQWRTTLCAPRSHPFYRSTVGFDRFFSLLDPGDLGRQPRLSPYNIERTGENAYRISVAVSGFSQGELSIVAKENTLTIKGEKTANENGQDKSEVLYRGIAAPRLRACVPNSRFRPGEGRLARERPAHVDSRPRDSRSQEAAELPIAAGAQAPQVVDGSAAKVAA